MSDLSTNSSQTPAETPLDDDSLQSVAGGIELVNCIVSSVVAAPKPRTLTSDAKSNGN